jgi:hypothetical protein
MENFIAWGDKPDTWPVHIESFNGVEGILKPGVIEAELKTRGLKALGVLVDANAAPAARWRRIRDRAIDAVPDIPQDLNPEGLICQSNDGVRFGVWLMPNNRACGMMETFLSLFVPEQNTGLWAFVQEHCREAKARHQAEYKEAHLDKVFIHAWLALQHPPGQSLHIAVLSKTLRIGSPHADAFVKWFRSLYVL